MCVVARVKVSMFAHVCTGTVINVLTLTRCGVDVERGLPGPRLRLRRRPRCRGFGVFTILPNTRGDTLLRLTDTARRRRIVRCTRQKNIMMVVAVLFNHHSSAR